MIKKKPKLNKTLFWDVNIKDIDFDKHKKYVIQRILVYGDKKDWQEAKKHYGIKEIKKIAVQISNLDKKSWNFW